MSPDLLRITVEDMIVEVRRELVQRRDVYPRLVASHKMNQRRANWQFDVMEALLNKLEAEHETNTAAASTDAGGQGPAKPRPPRGSDL
jgi:hypothetical protein